MIGSMALLRIAEVEPLPGCRKFSLAVDCRVAETVDLTRLVTGRIPKLFGR